MKAFVYVTLKPTVLDPQGQTIGKALNGMGHDGIVSVRQGKYFEIEATNLSREEVEQVALDVLSNPVIEDYRIEMEG